MKSPRHKAMDLLSRREHSVKELEAKLLSDYEAIEVEDVIKALVKEQLVSDERFCEAYINSRKIKGFGPTRILMELKQKGIAHEMASPYLDASVHDWYQEAFKVYQKKFQSVPHDYQEVQKRMSFLDYRGFDSSHIDHVVNDKDID